ncbi:MAG: DUF4139 domain-containing protein [Bacteroidetes bacterium]|nr:DUF4139 domain-containing protein [Bacteroidota bacterium]
MKIMNLFIAAMFCVPCIFKAEAQQEISSPVQSVIVYLDGAEVTQSKQVSLAAGRNKIVFTGLSQKLVSKSVQVNISGDVAILSVSDEINYLSKQDDQPRVKQLKDSVQYLNDALIQLRNEKDAFVTEKNLLIENKNLSGKDKALSVIELKAIADFYRLRIREINDEVGKIEKKDRKLNEVLVKANQQLNELNARFNMPMAEVSILLMSSAKTMCNIELKYIVTDAGWAPSYDLKAEDVNKPIELKYRAKVFNNTGVDWKDVKMRLSTADPMRSASKPEMDAWYLNYASNYNYQSNMNLKQQNYSMQKYSAPLIDADSKAGSTITREEFKGRVQQVQYEQIQVSELSADFEIKTAYSIPADSKPYIVDVTTYNLPATFQHFSSPKIDRDAFLIARITGWEDLDLVEGPANVYYGGTYVGQSYIQTRSVDDTLDLSLGRDNKIIVTRTKQKDFSTQKFIGSTKKEAYAYEIVIKNNRKTPVQIEINDQLPISQQGDISVEEIELSKAEKDIITGKLTWKYTLQPDEMKKLNLSFAIKYPKNKTITAKKYRVASRAMF